MLPGLQNQCGAFIASWVGSIPIYSRHFLKGAPLINNIMVCVTQQKTCERLIDKGYSLKNDEDMLYVVHVVNENEKLLRNYTDGEALEYLFGITKKLGAELVIERSKNIIDTLVKFADKNDVGKVVLGKSPDGKSKFEDKLKKKLKDIEMIII